MFGVDVDTMMEKFDKLVSTLETMNKRLGQTIQQVEALNANIERLTKELSNNNS